MSLTATPGRGAYGGAVVADDGGDSWPAAGHVLLDELRRAHGRVALITTLTSSDADDLVARMTTDLGVDVVRVGRALADWPHAPSIADVESACGEATLVADLDVLLWPEMHVRPLQLLARRARRRPTMAVWPGDISGGRASYSAAGRPDHHDIALRDVVVLRPRATRFPDEAPFTIERIPA